MVMQAFSVSFFRSEFNNFLYAPIGAERNGMPLSVLSALTRLNLDPWKEAAELSELPKGTATRRLAALIARLPGGRWPSDQGVIADRLIELLPSHGHSKISASKGHGLRGIAGAGATNILICAALAVVALVIAASRESPSRGDHVGAPVFSTTSPPQTPERISYLRDTNRLSLAMVPRGGVEPPTP